MLVLNTASYRMPRARRAEEKEGTPKHPCVAGWTERLGWVVGRGLVWRLVGVRVSVVAGTGGGFLHLYPHRPPPST